MAEHTHSPMSQEEQRLVQLCEMQERMWSSLRPDERDRILQTHMAAARGPTRNLVLLCEMTDSLQALRQAMKKETV